MLGTSADATVADARRAVDAAKRAFDTTEWSRDQAFRVQCLRQLHQALLDNRDQLSDIAPVLIIVDTLARTLAGQPENGEGMANFIDNAEDLSAAFAWASEITFSSSIRRSTTSRRSLARFMSFVGS